MRNANTVAQFLNQDLDELIMKNVEIAAFYKTALNYIQAELVKRNEEHFTYEPPVVLPDGSLKIRIIYGKG